MKTSLALILACLLLSGCDHEKRKPELLGTWAWQNKIVRIDQDQWVAYNAAYLSNIQGAGRPEISDDTVRLQVTVKDPPNLKPYVFTLSKDGQTLIGKDGAGDMKKLSNDPSMQIKPSPNPNAPKH